jgi:chitodextrinase
MRTTKMVRKIRFNKRTAIILAVLSAGAGVYIVFRSFAASGTLSLSPSSSNVGLGNNFTVTIHENSGTDPVNAVQANLTYPTSQLQFVSIDSTTSAFSVDAQATGGSGAVTIARGAAGGTSVTGDQIVAVVTFKAIGLGAGAVSFGAGSAIVRSTDNISILVTQTGGTYTVVDTAAPSVPTGLTSPSHGVTTANLSWTAATDNVGVAGYKVFRNGVQIATPATTSYADSGLTPNTAYTYTVAAFDSAGNASAQSASVGVTTTADTTAPSVPGAPTLTSHTLTQIVLGWAGSTDNVAVTTYKIFRNGTQIGTSPNTSYTDNSLTPGTTYSYTIASADAAGNTSAQSTAGSLQTLADTSAPSVPAGLTITSSAGTSVGLRWTASTDNVSVSGYRIYRGGVQIATAPGTTYTDSGLSAGTYVYTVAGYDAAGNVSAQSTSVSATITIAGDVNSDGRVDVFDLSILLSNYNSTNTACDLNHDGTVSLQDLSILLNNYGH